MFERCLLDVCLDPDQIGIGVLQNNLLLSYRRADVTRDIQVESFLGDSLHRDSLGIAVLFLAELVSLDDLGDVLIREAVLAFAFLEVFRAAGVDEKHVVRLLALLEHEDADRDARGVEQIGR